jgi:hypothetical protein
VGAPLRWLVVLAAGLMPALACGQTLFEVDEPASRVGKGSLSLGFHASRGEGTFTDSGDVFEAGDVDTRAAILGLDYRFAERWTLEAQVPFVRRRHTGRFSHNPARLVPARPQVPVIDDGDWHGGLQDFAATMYYDAFEDGMLVRPFVGLSVPTRDYPFFGNSAIGTRLVKGRVGVDVLRPIGLSDFHWRARYAYEIIERSYEGLSTNAHLGELELGWTPSRRLQLRGFVNVREGLGLGGDANYAGLTNQRWYFHDRTVRHNYTLAGVGATWALADRWSLSAVGMRLVRGAAIHNIRFAGTLEIAWHFDRGAD